MFSRLLSSLTVSWILVLLMCQDSICKRMWEYEPLSVVGESADPTKMTVDLRLERLGRGEFAVSGLLEWKYDVDKTTMIEATSYRSATGGEDDYVLLPWTISKQSFEQYTKTHYKDMIYKNVKDCTNMPKPENSIPWPRGAYTLNKCVFNGEGMPDVLPEGYYKVIFKNTGEVEWTTTVIARLRKINDLLG